MKERKTQENSVWRNIEIGTGITIILTLIGFAFWLGGMNNQLSANSKDVDELRKRLSEGGVKTLQYQGTTLSAMHRRRQFQFMTPSAEAWDVKRVVYSTPSNSTKLPADVQKDCGWQKVTEQRVEEFGRELINNGFTQGWRRYPYQGQGRYRDAGLWWVITVSDDFEVDRFVKFYLDFWGAPETYLEEFDTLGDVMPAKMIPHPVIPSRP